MTEIAVGASTWASGNQVCNGKAGILTAKLINSAIHRICGMVRLKNTGSALKPLALAANFVRSKVYSAWK